MSKLVKLRSGNRNVDVSLRYAVVDEVEVRGGCASMPGGGRRRAGAGAPAARQRGSAWEANSSLLHRSLLRRDSSARTVLHLD